MKTLLRLCFFLAWCAVCYYVPQFLYPRFGDWSLLWILVVCLLWWKVVGPAFERFDKAIVILLCLALPSCVIYDHEAVSSSGNKEHDKLWSLGGTNSQKGADGSSLVTDHQASFQHATQMVTAIAAGVATSSVSKAQEVTKQGLNAAAAKTAQQKIAADAAEAQATTAARTTVTGQAIGAGAPLTPITVTPP